MENIIIIAIVGSFQAIAVAFISGLFSREAKTWKAEQLKAEKRAKLRVQESILSMKLMTANTKLTVATAIAVQEGKSNGKMSEALAEAEKAEREYRDFINHIATEQMATDE